MKLRFQTYFPWRHGNVFENTVFNCKLYAQEIARQAINSESLYRVSSKYHMLTMDSSFFWLEALVDIHRDSEIGTANFCDHLPIKTDGTEYWTCTSRSPSDVRCRSATDLTIECGSWISNSNKRTYSTQNTNDNFFNNSNSSNFVTTLTKKRLPQLIVGIFHWTWLRCKTASSSDALGRMLQQWRLLQWTAYLHWALKGLSGDFSSLNAAAVSLNGTAVDFCSNIARSRATAHKYRYRIHLHYHRNRKSRRKKIVAWNS